jgi:DNA excision repair protein ERCC-3
MEVIGLKDGVLFRDYQIQAANAVLTPTPHNSTLAMPCGSGKTYVIALLISRLKRPTLCITTNRTLVQQTVRILNETLTCTAVDERDVKWNKKFPLVVVTTLPALSNRKKRSVASLRRIQRIIHHFKPPVVIFDEVHRVPATTFRSISRCFVGNPLKIGMSATLIRKDNNMRPIIKGIGPVEFKIRWQDLVKKGWLPHPTFIDCILMKNVDSNKNLRKSIMYAARMIVEKVQSIGMNCVVYVDDIPMLKALQELFGWHGIYGALSDKAKKSIIDLFRRGDISVMMVSEVGDEGLDFVAACGISLTRQGPLWQKIQRIGRTMRSGFIDKSTGQRIAWYFTICSATGTDSEKNTNQNLQIKNEGFETQVVLINMDVLKHTEIMYPSQASREK